MSAAVKVVVGGRREGKTTRLIALLYENPNAVFLSSHHDEARDLKQQYPDLADRILVAKENVLRGIDREAYVDNAEWVLRQFLGARNGVRVVSFTGHAEKVYNQRIAPEDRADIEKAEQP